MVSRKILVNSLMILIILLIGLFTAYSQVNLEKYPLGYSVTEKNVEAIFDEAASLYLDDPARALYLSSLLLEHAKTKNDEDLYLKVNRIAGLTYYHHGFFSLWEEHCEAQLRHTFVADNKQIKSRMYDHLGIALEMQGRFDESLKAYKESRELIRQVGNLHDYYTSGLNKALLYDRVKQYDKALDLLYSSKAYFEEYLDSFYLALTYQNLGMIHERFAEKDSMEFYTSKSLEIYLNLGDSVKVMDLHLNMAVFYIDNLQVEESKYHLEEAERLISETSPKRHLYLLLLANKELIQKNYSKADSLFRLSLEGFMELKNLKQAVESYRGLILVAHERDQTDSVKAILNNLITLQNDYFNRALLNKFAEYELKYETQQLEDNLNLLKLENENHQNRLRWLFIFFTFVAFSTAVISAQYFRLRRAYKKLFALSKESKLKSTIQLPLTSTETSEKDDGKDESGVRLELYNSAVKILLEEALYKDPKLTIQDLATTLNTNTKYLSQAINSCSNMNFNAFVNEFRVDEAKRILSQAEYESLSMDTVASMAGFSHRSQLYRVFSASTGLTPVQFKKLKQAE